MDTQTLELVGRHRLASELLAAGLEVAMPSRDRGVDLIAYVDVDASLDRFVARPIQLKAASRRMFNLLRKYERINGLLLAYVWHVDGTEPPETYALTYPEAFDIAETMGWTRTASWTAGGGYGTTRPSSRLVSALQPYRMTSTEWRKKVLA